MAIWASSLNSRRAVVSRAGTQVLIRSSPSQGLHGRPFSADWSEYPDRTPITILGSSINARVRRLCTGHTPCRSYTVRCWTPSPRHQEVAFETLCTNASFVASLECIGDVSRISARCFGIRRPGAFSGCGGRHCFRSRYEEMDIHSAYIE